MASRRTELTARSRSVRGVFRNLSRAGVAKNRSRTSIRVPGGWAAGTGADFLPASTTISQALCGAGRPRGDPHPADRADRRQRLAAEAERGDAQQVVLGQFRGAVPLDRQDQLFRGHAGAIVDDRDQGLAAFLQGDVDAPGAGVDRVLDQFLDRRSRPLDDFAGGDAVDEDRRQKTDRHLSSLC